MLDENVAQSPPKVAQNSHSSFYLNRDVFHKIPKVTKYSGYFCMIICSQELSKIAQSGHTDHGRSISKESQCFRPVGH